MHIFQHSIVILYSEFAFELTDNLLHRITYCWCAIFCCRMCSVLLCIVSCVAQIARLPFQNKCNTMPVSIYLQLMQSNSWTFKYVLWVTIFVHCRSYMFSSSSFRCIKFTSTIQWFLLENERMLNAWTNKRVKFMPIGSNSLACVCVFSAPEYSDGEEYIYSFDPFSSNFVHLFVDSFIQLCCFLCDRYVHRHYKLGIVFHRAITKHIMEAIFQ